MTGFLSSRLRRFRRWLFVCAGRSYINSFALVGLVFFSSALGVAFCLYGCVMGGFWLGFGSALLFFPFVLFSLFDYPSLRFSAFLALSLPLFDFLCCFFILSVFRLFLFMGV